MKKYNVLLVVCVCLLSVFLLTSCGKKDVKSGIDVSVSKREEVKKKDLTIDDFISIGRKYGYKPIEETDMPKEQLEQMKQKIDQATKSGKIKSMTTIANMPSLSDIKSNSSSDMTFSVILLNVCEDEETAKNFNQTIKLMYDVMNKMDSMKGKCTFNENKKANGAFESVFCANVSDDIKMYSIVSNVKDKALYIQHVGKNRENLDKFLNEIGF